MSGKYLHGLIVDGDYVDVRDNIFSHSELREKWTGKENKHKLIKEWSWDYVTKKFTESFPESILIAEKWIKKNFSTHKQLISWVDKNWKGLINSDEREREDYIWQLIGHMAKHKNRLVGNFLKAYADRKKADADSEKAYADSEKAYADWKKADADREKADAGWKKADADWKKAYADWKKADADWKKADADREKACADRKKACADWEKADAEWKVRIMKPVFMELLKKYPNKYWEEKNDNKT